MPKCGMTFELQLLRLTVITRKVFGWTILNRAVLGEMFITGAVTTDGRAGSWTLLLIVSIALTDIASPDVEAIDNLMDHFSHVQFVSMIMHGSSNIRTHS